MLNYVMEYGTIQARDINPAVPGATTQDLTNPRVVDNLEASEQILTGQLGQHLSPIYYLAIAIAVLLAVSYFQK